MKVTINIGGFAAFLLGLKLSGDDSATVIGDSRLAYLATTDKGYAFMPACVWHDAAYLEDSSIQGPNGMTRADVDQELLKKMLDIAGNDYDLEKEACELYLIVRKYGAKLWEGES